MRSVPLLLCSAALAAAAGNPVKYHPGHYVALETGASLEAFPYVDEPAIRGFNIRYTWAALEPEESRYDFAPIRRDLAIASKHGKQLVAFLTDKTFSAKAPNPLRRHLREYGLVNSTGGIRPAPVHRDVLYL